MSTHKAPYERECRDVTEAVNYVSWDRRRLVKETSKKKNAFIRSLPLILVRLYSLYYPKANDPLSIETFYIERARESSMFMHALVNACELDLRCSRIY